MKSIRGRGLFALEWGCPTWPSASFNPTRDAKLYSSALTLYEAFECNIYIPANPNFESLNQHDPDIFPERGF